MPNEGMPNGSDRPMLDLSRGRTRFSPDFPLGVELEVFIRRKDAERFVEEVRGDDPELASYLWIEERELEAGGRHWGGLCDNRF
jgi:hypothetical protein